MIVILCLLCVPTVVCGMESKGELSRDCLRAARAVISAQPPHYRRVPISERQLGGAMEDAAVNQLDFLTQIQAVTKNKKPLDVCDIVLLHTVGQAVQANQTLKQQLARLNVRKKREKLETLVIASALWLIIFCIIEHGGLFA